MIRTAARPRRATRADVFPILQLYQKAARDPSFDRLFLDYRKLAAAIGKPDGLWLLQEAGGRPAALVSGLVDAAHGVAKITRMLVDPELRSPRELARAALRGALELLDSARPRIEVIYTTTFTMSLDEQQLTLDEGFKVLGIFPNALGADRSKLNGLTARFSPEALGPARFADFALHPALAPFYRLAAAECGLGPLRAAAPEPPAAQPRPEPPGALELIRASGFVGHRFDKLLAHRAGVIDFYPFHRPNALITDPAQTVEIFVKIMDDLRFAAIIGERLERTVDPVELYRGALGLLRGRGMSYVEIINDAADGSGNDCILRAGFTPTAYFPALKRQGSMRRDYAVFGRAYENLRTPSRGAAKTYRDYFRLYYKAERRNALG